MKINLLADILEKLKDTEKWFCTERQNQDISFMLKESLPILKKSRFMSLIEFGRAVHAEMAAIVDSARRGVSTDGQTMFTSTFPCHDCAKHIVAAGIKRLVYIEPYPKSLASELYLDSISLDKYGHCEDGHVSFESFVGVAPRRYIDFFKMGNRKKDGRVLEWIPEEAYPILHHHSQAYLKEEEVFVRILTERMGEAGILKTKEGGNG